MEGITCLLQTGFFVRVAILLCCYQLFSVAATNPVYINPGWIIVNITISILF